MKYKILFTTILCLSFFTFFTQTATAATPRCVFDEKSEKIFFKYGQSYSDSYINSAMSRMDQKVSQMADQPQQYFPVVNITLLYVPKAERNKCGLLFLGKYNQNQELVFEYRGTHKFLPPFFNGPGPLDSYEQIELSGVRHYDRARLYVYEGSNKFNRYRWLFRPIITP